MLSSHQWTAICSAPQAFLRRPCLVVAMGFLGSALALALGCGSESVTTSSQLSERLLGKAGPTPIPVGVLFSQTGTMSISETQMRHAVIMAIDQINAEGGVLGRPLTPVIKDGKSRADIFAKRTQEFVDDQVPVIFGGWRSVDRKAMLPIIENSGLLLFYPLQYEGNEASRNVFSEE